MLVFALGWFGSVGQSVRYWTQLSTKITDLQNLYQLISHHHGTKIFVIAEPSFPPHPAISVHPSRSIMHECHSSIYLFRAIRPITSHQWILTSTLGYYLESEYGSLSLFFVSDVQCVLCA